MKDLSHPEMIVEGQLREKGPSHQRRQQVTVVSDVTACPTGQTSAHITETHATHVEKLDTLQKHVAVGNQKPEQIPYK